MWVKEAHEAVLDDRNEEFGSQTELSGTAIPKGERREGRGGLTIEKGVLGSL